MIKSKLPTKEYDAGYDRIFGKDKKKVTENEQSTETRTVPELCENGKGSTCGQSRGLFKR